MLLDTLTRTSAAVAATRSRNAKRDLLAETLRQAGDQVGLVAGYLAGSIRQRRTGLGWRALSELPEPAGTPSRTVAEVDAALEALSTVSGPGSVAARRAATDALFSTLTGDEQQFLRGLIGGGVRQGALDAVMLDAIAAAFEAPIELIRRAAFLGGSTAAVAEAAAADHTAGGTAPLEAFRLQVGRGVRPMLAASAPDIDTAWPGFGTGPVAVDAKLDGIRVQIHRDGDQVCVFSRSLDDITGQVPSAVELALSLPVQQVVLDGEALGMSEGGRPEAFQVSASRAATRASPVPAGLHTFVFDLLHADGVDYIDEPATVRFAALQGIAGPHLVGRIITDDVEQALAFNADILARGHEGVVLKAIDAPYAAGRRGAGWVKVKPRHTLDLVVLAVEHGSGRRRGTLSNIHLGARDPATGGFVMVGKTFKGMTDQMLAWQTQRFTELATHTDGYVVHVRPEQVVEIALDGVQTSRRYPGGVALRFARVIGYRDDKPAEEADSISTVQALRHT